MTGPPRIIATLSIFAAMILLMVLRPRRLNEAWWTSLAAIAMLALRLVTPHQAFAVILSGKNTLLFLLSLLALSNLIGKSGFFDWAAIRCARVATGDARALYRNAFIAGALVTAILSLDTTAVMLTPVMLALVKRLKVPAAPYVLLCAFVANVGSLLLPISNLTNLLFADSFHLTFAAFAGHMILPQIVALLATYACLRWSFRRDLPASFDAASLPDPASTIPNRPYFRICVAVLMAVLVGYFAAPLLGLEPWVFAFAAVAVLGVAGAACGRVHIPFAGELAWDLFPFVIGLFIAVQGLENLGIVSAASRWLAAMPPSSLQELFAAAGGTALAANLANNLPAALVVRSVLAGSQAPTPTVLAALVGANVGPIVTPFASLATMLVLAFARREGEEISAGLLIRLGLWAAPVVLILTTLALAVAR